MGALEPPALHGRCSPNDVGKRQRRETVTPLSAAKGGPLVTKQSASPEDGGPRTVRCRQSATLGGIGGELRRGSHPRSMEGLWRTLASRGRGSPSITRASSGLPALRCSSAEAWLRSLFSPGDSGRRRSSEPRVLWAPVMPLIHGGTLRASPRLPVPRFPQCERGEWRASLFRPVIPGLTCIRGSPEDLQTLMPGPTPRRSFHWSAPGVCTGIFSYLPGDSKVPTSLGIPEIGTLVTRLQNLGCKCVFLHPSPKVPLLLSCFHKIEIPSPFCVFLAPIYPV